MVEWGETIVLHVRRAIWCNLLTLAAKQRCEIFKFEPIAVNLSFYALHNSYENYRANQVKGHLVFLTWPTWNDRKRLDDHRKVLFRSDVFVSAALALQFPIYPMESAALSFQHTNPMWFICHWVKTRHNLLCFNQWNCSFAPQTNHTQATIPLFAQSNYLPQKR